MKITKAISLTVMAILLINPAYADESLINAFKEGKPYADIRLRYEHVEQDGLINANAQTARTRVGFKTAKFYDFSGAIEIENIAVMGNDDYNDSRNGRTDHATVADVESTEINQLFLEHTGFLDTAIKVGRQAIVEDNQRFIGAVGWRQNNQTFDAVKITNSSMENTEIKYGYIGNVNRIFGDAPASGDFESNSHYYKISNTSLLIGTITTYGYLFDFQQDSAANSSKTFGGILSGKVALTDEVTFKYYGEYANQEDYGDNTTSYSTNYYHFAPAIECKGLTATVGYEVLGSDNGRFAFRTPLATGHKFNGWSDKFLTTPAMGLQDFYVDLTYKIKDLQGHFDFLNGFLAQFQYHDFNTDSGSLDHGSEWGLFFKQPVDKYMYVQAKYANYSAENTSTDTQKWTFDVGINF